MSLPEAYFFSAERHTTQRRKNAAASPYINHPIEVALFVSQVDPTATEAIIAGVLHDTVEDTATTMEEIEQLFGAKVASIVGEVTDDKSLPKVDRKRLQIEHAPKSSPEAQLVKLADKYSNLKNLSTDPPKMWSKEVVQGYALWSHAVVAAILKSRTIPQGFIDRLAHVFEQFQIRLDSEPNQEELEAYYAFIKE